MHDETVLLNLGIILLVLAFVLSSRRGGTKGSTDDWHDHRPKR